MKNAAVSQLSGRQHANVRSLLTWCVILLAALAGVFTYRITTYDFKTLDDQKYTWNELKGDWVVVNYFAKWCAPCLREVPELNAFYEASQGDGVAMFMVSYDPLSAQELTSIQQEYKISVPIIVPSDNVVMPNTHPRFLPATFIINPQGGVAMELFGEQTAQSLMTTLKALQETESN